ncbi:hypothetical protein [Streptomyces sp. NPDC002402]
MIVHKSHTENLNSKGGATDQHQARPTQGIETLGLERATKLLGRHDKPVRLGQVMAADGSWVFMLFLTEDGSALVACTGVCHRDQ